MTSEKRTLKELRDIAGLEAECPDCAVRIFYPIGEGRNPRPSVQCPNCNAVWLSQPGPNPPLSSLAMQIRDARLVLQRLIYSSDVKAHVRFQISGLTDPK